MTTSAFRTAAACALLASTCLVSPAYAQVAHAYRNLDANGVDLTHGDHVLTFTEAVIGSGDDRLALERVRGTNASPHEWDGIRLNRQISGNQVFVVVTLGPVWERFTGTMSALTPDKANGATLTFNGNHYIYRDARGRAITFGDPTESYAGGDTNFCRGDVFPTQPNCEQVPLSITEPDGRTSLMEWELHSIPSGMNFPQDHHHYYRLKTVSNGSHLSASFHYIANDLPPGSQPPPTWFERTGADLHNGAVSASPIGSVSYAAVTGGTNVTDMGGRTWRITGPGTIRGIRRPGEAADSTSVAYAGGGVSSVTRDGVTIAYSRSVSGSNATMVVTDANGGQSTIVSNMTIGRPVSATDPLGRTTAFQYDANGRLTRTTLPEGNAVELVLDARGNALQTRMLPKPGSGAAVLTTVATYDANCWSPATCNQPVSITDPRGHTTDFTYGAHGGITSITLPAPAPGVVRPQTRYGYAVAAGAWRLTSISACQTGTSCDGTADEVRTTLAYDANGNVTQVSTGAGDGGLTATQAMTYDAFGNPLTVDGPLPGSADTVRYRYDANRQLVGIVSPDPDGTGLLRHRAERRTYSNAGFLTRIERGTVLGQSDAQWNAFAPLEAVEIGYANGRPVTQRLVAGGTTHALVQTGYDALGRVSCTAQRMNPAAFGSPPANACALGTQGAFGPDRIVRNVHDAAGQVTRVEVAVGTADQANEASATYRPNGQVETLTDGEGNRTT